MAFTQTDLETIESAIVALASGQRVVSAEIDGNKVEWNRADLDKLRQLRKEIMAELQSAAARRRFVLTSTSKGL